MIKNRSNYSLKKYLNCYYQKEPTEIESNYSRDQLFRKFYGFEKHELKNTIKIFEHLLNDNIDIVQLEKDMIWCKYILKSGYDEYFMLNFMDKNDSERREFLTYGYRHRYFNFLNELSYQKFYSDKYKTYKKYKKFYKREMILINDLSDFDKFKNFIIKHNKVIKKQYDGSLGVGIEIIKKGEISKALFKRLLKDSGKFILEELIQQSDEMSMLHPQSVNTVRIYGYMDDDYSIKACFPLIKMGAGISIVDNGGAGGIFAAIGDDGLVITNGGDELGNQYVLHPDTKVTIKGFKLPDWEQAINIVKSASSINKHTRLIGRDLAHTNDGRVIVEGNGKGQLLCRQIAMQKGIKKELEKIIHWNSVQNKEKYPFGDRKKQ